MPIKTIYIYQYILTALYLSAYFLMMPEFDHSMHYFDYRHMCSKLQMYCDLLITTYTFRPIKTFRITTWWTTINTTRYMCHRSVLDRWRFNINWSGTGGRGRGRPRGIITAPRGFSESTVRYTILKCRKSKITIHITQPVTV